MRGGRQGLRIAAVLAVLAALFLGATPPGRRLAVSLFSPVASVAAATVRGILRLLPGSGAGSRAEELARLRERAAALEAAAAEAEALRRQNAQLRETLHLEPPKGWGAVAAQVIGRDPLQWNEILTINRGYADGVVTGAAVLSDGALFGRVLHSDRHSAQVVALTSPQCRFGVRLPAQGNRPAVEGVLHGAGDLFFDGRRGFVVECLPPVLEVSADEMLVSSALGGWMPDGLPVGHVQADAPDGGCLHVVDTARGELHGLPCQEDATPFFVIVLKPE